MKFIIDTERWVGAGGTLVVETEDIVSIMQDKEDCMPIRRVKRDAITRNSLVHVHDSGDGLDTVVGMVAYIDENVIVLEVIAR